MDKFYIYYNDDNDAVDDDDGLRTTTSSPDSDAPVAGAELLPSVNSISARCACVY